MIKKIIKYSIVTLVLIPILLLITLSVIYSPTYVYRLVFYNVGDVYDYKHFEKRVIKTTETRSFTIILKIQTNYKSVMF